MSVKLGICCLLNFASMLWIFLLHFSPLNTHWRQSSGWMNECLCCLSIRCGWWSRWWWKWWWSNWPCKLSPNSRNSYYILSLTIDLNVAHWVRRKNVRNDRTNLNWFNEAYRQVNTLWIVMWSTYSFVWNKYTWFCLYILVYTSWPDDEILI